MGLLLCIENHELEKLMHQHFDCEVWQLSFRTSIPWFRSQAVVGSDALLFLRCFLPRRVEGMGSIYSRSSVEQMQPHIPMWVLKVTDFLQMKLPLPKHEDLLEQGSWDCMRRCRKQCGTVKLEANRICQYYVTDGASFGLIHARFIVYYLPFVVSRSHR